VERGRSLAFFLFIIGRRSITSNGREKCAHFLAANYVLTLQQRKIYYSGLLSREPQQKEIPFCNDGVFVTFIITTNIRFAFFVCHAAPPLVSFFPFFFMGNKVLLFF